MTIRRPACAVLAAGLTALSLAGSALAEPARTGALSGENGHVVTGTVTIEATDGVYSIVLGEDFTLDGAPDPQVAFADGGSEPATLLAPLEALSGAQDYALPAGVDPATIETVWIWCEEFTVSLGVAHLE